MVGGGSKSAKGGPNPLADMDRGGPNPLADGSKSAVTPALQQVSSYSTCLTYFSLFRTLILCSLAKLLFGCCRYNDPWFKTI